MNPVGSPDMAAARLAAFRLVEAVQTRDSGDELERRLADAERNGWTGVVLVLLYAQCARAELADGPRLAVAIEQLRVRAELEGDVVMLAAALAFRAEQRYWLDSAEKRRAADCDLARATALLDGGSGGALERATALVGCALGYCQRELWELEEELYGVASALLPECEEPLLDRVVLANRVDSQVLIACGLRELSETAKLLRLRPPADAAVRAALAGAAPVAWVLATRVAAHLLGALLGEPAIDSAGELRAEVAAASGPGVDRMHAPLHLAEAVRSADAKAWEIVAQESAAALSAFATTAPTPMVALALRLEAEAAGESSRALRYADYSARLRSTMRLRALGAARAQIQAEHLRIEHDRHAREALVDELTGVANRRAYARQLEALSRSPTPRRLSAVLVDVDHFKAVNDAHGHAVGDAVLRRVADQLAAATRAVDFVARLGGDEFVLLLDDVDERAARRRANELLDGIDAVPWDTLSGNLQVSASVGIATGSGADVERLVERADRALYDAKNQGRAQVATAGEGTGRPASQARHLGPEPTSVPGRSVPPGPGDRP